MAQWNQVKHYVMAWPYQLPCSPQPQRHCSGCDATQYRRTRSTASDYHTECVSTERCLVLHSSNWRSLDNPFYAEHQVIPLYSTLKERTTRQCSCLIAKFRHKESLTILANQVLSSARRRSKISHLRGSLLTDLSNDVNASFLLRGM